MRSTTLLAGLLLLVAFPHSLSAETPVEGENDFGRGASLYSANCGRCHNARGAVEFSDEYWPMIVTHMRVIAGLPGDQARAIQAFLLASNNPPAPRAMPPETPTEALSGEALVQQYGCAGCHEIDGSGGSIGPSLDGLFERRSEEWVREKIQRPREDNPKTVMPEFGLTDDQVSLIMGALKGDG